jgi:hypothetical protein
LTPRKELEPGWRQITGLDLRQRIGAVINQRGEFRMCFERAGHKPMVAAIGFLCCVLPFLLGSLTVSAGSVSLAWNRSPSSDVAGYELFYGMASGQYTYGLDVDAKTTITVSGLTEGRTYYFAVVAYNRLGDESGYSNELTNAVPVLPAAPIGESPPISRKPVAAPTNPGTVPSRVTATALTARILVPNAAKADDAADEANFSAAPLVSAAGVYNGLFYQIDQGGAPSATVASAGFLGNCTIRSNGNYTARLACAGRFYSISGTFNAAGDTTTIICRAASGLPDLHLALHVESGAGMERITGLVSNMDALDSWSAPLAACRSTNSFAPTAKVLLLSRLAADQSDGSPDNARCILTVATNGMVSLAGRLEDGSPIAQTVAITGDGSFPVYVSLHPQPGLLTGWMHLTEGVADGSLTWIRESESSPPLIERRWLVDVLRFAAEPAR